MGRNLYKTGSGQEAVTRGAVMKMFPLASVEKADDGRTIALIPPAVRQANMRQEPARKATSTVYILTNDS
jgi:hypothetical protein